MKISLKWLSDHIDLNDYFAEASSLAKILTDAGLEVEAVENNSEKFKNVVVGHIVKLDRHPNADRLTVCQVDTGEGSLRQIVCGAKNHKAGDKVVVTLPGAVLPGNFEIKKSKIRDVESLGMLASESELGLKKESEGIMILPADAPMGRPFAEYMGLDDVIFEINVSPNRADCLSHLGLARELSCLLNRPLKSKALMPKTSSGLSVKAKVQVSVPSTQLCPRYAGRLIAGVIVGPSPAWLKARLESVGLNSINNVVDITNFVMLDVGQPLHAFDLNSLHGSKIIVDTAPLGEVFKTLDGSELKLGQKELTIRDAERAVCVAGVIGGLNSGVTEATTTLFIESAHFAMDSVRKTARRHGLQTDSAYRFSRGTDPAGVVRALDLACTLIQQVAGGEVSADHWDIYPSPMQKAPIAVTRDYVEQRLGFAVHLTQMVDWFTRLGCQVKVDGDLCQVTPPEYRMDLDQAVDLVEEYGRLVGYDNIPETLPVLSYAPLKADKPYGFENLVAGLARQLGFSQCVNFGFTGAKSQASILGKVELYRAAGLEMDPQPIMVQNPLNEEMNVMRVSLLPGLIKNFLHNVRHGNSQGRLFEVGATFRKGPEGYLQDGKIAFLLWGDDVSLWQKKANPVFFELKGRLQSLLESLALGQAQWKAWTGEVPQLIHPAQTATLFVEGRNVGFMGAVHPKWLSDEKLRVPVAVAELDLKALSRNQPRPIKFKEVSKFPSVERDLAFVLPKSMAAAEVSAEIRRTSGALLQSIDVFDVFEGDPLPAGQLSVAYRMVFQDVAGTLTEERLTDLQSQIVANIEKKLAVKVR